MTLVELLTGALHRRATLLSRLHAEGTDCYRLFHGATEGRPGHTVDRYGSVLLVQTWREPLSSACLQAISSEVDEVIDAPLQLVWNHRSPSRGGGKPRFDQWHTPELPSDIVGMENGIRYDVHPRHGGTDPRLFLDLRAARRRVRMAGARTVLNLFAYTCGMGVAAAMGGAEEVWNVDFSRGALAVGGRNASLNGVAVGDDFRLVREDVFAVVRQMAGLPLGGRRERRRRRPQSFAPRGFDLVVLDPPRWAKSAFGTVDVVRDYPSLFKPAVLVTRPGGVVLATNHVPSVDRDSWMRILLRCAEKAGRTVREFEFVEPESDFPSPDGRSPSKVAWLVLD